MKTALLLATLLAVASQAQTPNFKEQPTDAEVGIGMVCRGHCFANNLIMRAVGPRMIIAPPLVITRDQVDELVGLIRRCLDLTLADARTQGWL